MDQYLVRKRPFEVHEEQLHAPPPKKGRAGSANSSSSSSLPANKRHGMGAATASNARSAAAAASSSSFVAASSLSPPSSPARPSSWRPAPVLKQLSLTQLSKVTSLDDAAAREAFLQSAVKRGDWHAVREQLQQLKGVFVSKAVLEKTRLGHLLTQIKKSAHTATTTHASPQPQAAAAAAAAAATPTDAAAAATSSPAPASASAAAAGDSSSSQPSVSPLQSECVALALELLSVWKAQVKKELEMEQATGSRGQAPLDFSSHSTLKNRCATYKSLYFIITQRDVAETPPEKQARRRALQPPPLAKDGAAATVAWEAERALFRLHRDRQLRAHLASTRSELLSSSSAAAQARDDDQCVTVEPPGYALHARSLIYQLRTQQAQLDRMRKWVVAGGGTELTDEQLTALRADIDGLLKDIPR